MLLPLSALIVPFAAAVASPAPLDETGRLIADVAVVADHADPAVVDAVRGAVFAAVRARGARVVDLQAQGLKRAVDACTTLACRRDLARRRGAEWHVVVDDDGKVVVLDLMDGDAERAHVVLTGARVMLLGGVPDAVDALFEAALPHSVVDRERAVARARAAVAAGDVVAARAAWATAIAQGANDRAVELTFERARSADDVGDDDGVDAAFDDAEAALLDAPGVSPAGRAQLVDALLEHRWNRAVRAASIADADTGPDHDALAAAAATQWERLAERAWVPDDVRARAVEQAAQLRPCAEPAPQEAPALSVVTPSDAAVSSPPMVTPVVPAVDAAKPAIGDVAPATTETTTTTTTTTE